MKPILFIGCGTALVTPFKADGSVNYDELEKLIEFQIAEKADSIIICGTTGESSTLSLEEKKQIIDFTVKKVAKRIPVISGTGGNNTKDVIELSKYAKKAGVDGLLIVTPYYNKTTQNGLIAHYTKIASSVNLPIILYNVPSRTGLNIEPETCFELSKIPNIVGLKEASGNISQVAKIANLCKDNLYIYSGNDDQIIPTLSLGGMGVISVLSNLYPRQVHNLVYNYLSGDFKKALEVQLNMLPLINLIFSEVNPIPIKEAMNMAGFSVGEPRLPLVSLSTDKKIKISEQLRKYAKIE